MRKAILTAALLLAAAATAGTAAGNAPAMTSRFGSMISNVQLPGRYFDLNQNVGEYAPGASLPLQSCACDIYFSVIEGELTLTLGSETKVYGPGKSGYVPAGLLNQHANKGTTKARVFYTMIQLARGSDTWTFTPGPGASTPAAMPSFSGWATALGLNSTESKVTIVQDISDWDSGFKAPLHVMNHPHVFTVLEGENTVRYQDGAVDVFKSGQQFVMTVGRPGTMENAGTANNRLLMTMVLTSSAPPFSPVAAPAAAVGAPRTGDAGLAAESAPTCRAGPTRASLSAPWASAPPRMGWFGGAPITRGAPPEPGL